MYKHRIATNMVFLYLPHIMSMLQPSILLSGGGHLAGKIAKLRKSTYILIKYIHQQKYGKPIIVINGVKLVIISATQQ